MCAVQFDKPILKEQVLNLAIPFKLIPQQPIVTNHHHLLLDNRYCFGETNLRKVY